MVVGESPLKDAYRLAVWGPWRHVLEAAPPGWEIRASRALGHLAASVPTETRARVRANLARAFPELSEAARSTIARHGFAAHFSNQYASFSFEKMTPRSSDRYLRWTGMEHLVAARQAGVGVVLVHPHMGPAQLPLCVLGATGWTVHQVGGGVTTPEKSRVGAWAMRTRSRLEARLPATLHDGRSYLRGCLRALARGEIVLTAGDGTGGGVELGRRETMDVLGQPFRVPVFPAWLAHRGGARLHTLTCTPEGSRHLARIGPALPVSGEATQDARMLADWLDATLRAHPGDWLLWDAFAPGQLIAGP